MYWAKMLSLIVFFIHFVDLVAGDFCSEHNMNVAGAERDTYSTEYGIEKHSKSLHCCGSNYKSIVWMRGDKVYPWNDGVSNFIVDPDSHNQTLYIKELSRDDGGSYRCHIIDQSLIFYTKHIQLNVFENEFSGIPQKTFSPPAKVALDLGESAKLYCETFVGKIDLPDARSKISWFKEGANNTRTLLSNNSRILVKEIIKDEGLTVGLYLVINNVQPADYGHYVCSVSNTDDQITEMKSELVVSDHFFSFSRGHVHMIILFLVCGLIMIIVAAYLIYYRFRYQIQLRVRQLTTSNKNETNKEYDIFILYEPKEVNFVTGVLIPTLINEHDYNVYSLMLKCGSAINMECQARIALSRCVLVVLATTEMSDQQSQKYFTQKLYSVSNLYTKIICLLVQDQPEISSPQYSQLTSSMNLTVLMWPVYKKDWNKLWRNLRLHLPVKRKIIKSPNAKNYSTVNDKHIMCSV